MNDTDRVIDHIFNMMPEDENEAEVFSAALNALRAEADRANGCPKCQRGFTGGYPIRLLDPDAIFCSRCGRKLERENPPPLTPDQLREINQDMENRRWVWIELLKIPHHNEIESAYYRVQSDYTHGRAFCCGYPGYGVHFEYHDYGITWLAYNYQPKEVLYDGH
jgi:hypothetical protein